MAHLLLLSAVAAGLRGRRPLLRRLLGRARLLRLLRISVGGLLLGLRLRIGMAVRLLLRLACEGRLLRAHLGRRQPPGGRRAPALEQRKDIHWSTSQRIGRSGEVPASREAFKDS